MRQHRWIARLLTAALVAGVLVVATGAPDDVSAQTGEISITFPDEVAVGESVELTGSIDGGCQGPIEVGLWPKDPPVVGVDYQDFRDGTEIVLHRPSGPTFTADVVIPEIGVQQAWFYVACPGPESVGFRMSHVTIDGAEPDDGPTSAEPDEDGANGAPVANPDRLSVAEGEALRQAAPGVLGNDSDPDGDQLVAVRTGVATTVGGGRLSFRPDGSVDFTVDPDAPAETATGAVCVAYHARDPQGVTSEPTTLIVLVGDVGDEDAAVAAVASDGGCRPPVVGENAMELTLTDGPGDLPGAALAAAAPMLPRPIDTGTWLLAAPAQEGLAGVDPLAVQVPSNLNGCFRSNCLWGYFGPPSYACNQTTSGSWLNRRYGSMTGYAYLRKGLSDYVRVRPVFFQDGNRLDPQFVWRGGWKKKTFPYLAGPEMYNRWVYARLHMRFGSPGSTYLIGFEAEWYDERPFGRDRLLARSGPPAMLPYSCVAGGGL